MHYKNPHIIGMGDDEGYEFKLRTVDPACVRKMRALAEGI
jgi:copper homeostasis protein